MKSLVILVYLFAQFSLSAQNTLFITTSKTTSLIFPFPVKYVDRGSKDVLVQQVRDADNILLVKSATEHLTETNLSVVTSDGSLYGFRVNYVDNPATLVWEIPAQQEANSTKYARDILDNPRTVHGIRSASYGIFSSVSGIYIHGGTIYYQLELWNSTTIDYDIDFLRFSIHDKKKSKRTASQEVNLTPVAIVGNTSQVKANTMSTIVVALPKFTIPDAKYLSIRIGEKNGGRHLHMRVHNRSIIRAIPLPQLK